MVHHNSVRLLTVDEVDIMYGANIRLRIVNGNGWVLLQRADVYLLLRRSPPTEDAPRNSTTKHGLIQRNSGEIRHIYHSSPSPPNTLKNEMISVAEGFTLFLRSERSEFGQVCSVMWERWQYPATLTNCQHLS